MEILDFCEILELLRKSWILDFGFLILDSGIWISDFRFWIRAFQKSVADRYIIKLPNVASKAFLRLKSLASKAYLKAKLQISDLGRLPPIL